MRSSKFEPQCGQKEKEKEKEKKHLPIKHLKSVNIFLSLIITEICTLYVKRININKGFKKKQLCIRIYALFQYSKLYSM